MPVRRRTSKRNVSLEAEAEAWRNYFECGFDFFEEAAELTGLTEPVNAPLVDRPLAEKLWKAAADDAWQRVGHLIGERHAG